jgi:hypothetical protein
MNKKAGLLINWSNKRNNISTLDDIQTKNWKCDYEDVNENEIPVTNLLNPSSALHWDQSRHLGQTSPQMSYHL